MTSFYLHYLCETSSLKLCHSETVGLGFQHRLWGDTIQAITVTPLLMFQSGSQANLSISNHTETPAFQILSQCAYCIMRKKPFSDHLETRLCLHICKFRVLIIIIKCGFTAVGVLFTHYMWNRCVTEKAVRSYCGQGLQVQAAWVSVLATWPC